MAIWKLSVEDKDKLIKESEAKKAELETLQGKSWDDLWEEDLEAFNKAIVEKVTFYSVAIDLKIFRKPKTRKIWKTVCAKPARN